MRILQLAYGVLSIDCRYYVSTFIQELFEYIKRTIGKDSKVELLVGVPKFFRIFCPIKSVDGLTLFPYTKNKGNIIENSRNSNEGMTIFKYPYLPIGLFKNKLDEIWYRYLEISLKSREIPTKSYNLIHANFMRPPGYAASIIAHKNKIPFILTVHENPEWLKFNLNKETGKSIFILRKADAIIRPSYHNIHLIGRINRNVRVIPNGYDDELFKFREMSSCRKHLGLAPDDIIILSVGGLSPIKGHIYSIFAFEKLVKKYNREGDGTLLYLIIGDGPLYSTLKAMVRKRDLENNIKLLGYISHRELPIYYCSSNVFVFPSLYESFGISLLEAQAMGVPAVVSSGVGASYILRYTSGGIIVPPRNVDELAKALEKALKMEWNRKEIASKTERFSWKSVTKKVIQLYEEIYNSKM